MLENKTRLAILSVLLLALVLVVILSVRATNQPAPVPTISVDRVQTAAVATFGAGLTRTAAAMPTSTVTSPPVPTDTPAGTQSASPTPSCYRLRYVRDITVPDYTLMTPGQIFTKTWEVENSGTCAWRKGFEFSLIGGDAMGGSTLTLTEIVNPGERYQLAIPMAAPTDKTGTVVGTWQMSDENGTFFGDALTVIITLGGTTTGTPEPGGGTLTPTP
jgi:hypothetical protein